MNQKIIDYYPKTGITSDVRMKIRNFTRDIVNIIGFVRPKKKYPSENKYNIVNEMLFNEFDVLSGKHTNQIIFFDFTKVEDKQYFIDRFKIYIDEILERTTINEKYLIICKYKDKQNRIITKRRSLTDDTAISIRRQILNDKFTVGYINDEEFGVRNNEEIIQSL
jgi:hypothetical protein